MLTQPHSWREVSPTRKPNEFLLSPQAMLALSTQTNCVRDATQSETCGGEAGLGAAPALRFGVLAN